jgi:hypothetical protein
MRTIQQLCVAGVLTLIFTISAAAGVMQTPGVTAGGDMLTPGVTAAGEIQFPGATGNPMTDVLLGFLLNLSSLL